MKKILFLCVLLLALVSVRAQKVYFIYLQSENGSPFFIKMNDKVYSSTTGGYLILPGLKDSAYVFSVGRLGRQSAEPRFSISLAGNDKGFLIREAEGQVSLFNLQTMAVVMPVTTELINNNGTAQRTDAFTKLLAKAADDSTLLYVAVVSKEEAKPKPSKSEPQKKEVIAEVPPINNTTKEDVVIAKEEPVQKSVQSNTVVQVDSGLLAADQTKQSESPTLKHQENSAIAEVIKKPVEEKKDLTPPAEDKQPPKTQNESNNTTEYKRSQITRRSESSTSEGFGLVFLDKNETAVDTIRILIPNPKNVVKLVASEPEKVKPEIVEPVTTSPAVVNNGNTAKKEKLSCIYLASENEFKRLRRVMAAKSTDEGMLSEAKKGFKSTCFTTEQIRNLSTLFLTAEGKYSFFDIAYTHAVDSEAFITLGSEIKDDYYSRRFKALVGN